VSRQGTAARFHVDSGASEHRDGTLFFPEPSTNEGRGEVASHVLTVLNKS